MWSRLWDRKSTAPARGELPNTSTTPTFRHLFPDPRSRTRALHTFFAATHA